jgi:ribosomal-protein-alanine N-acetyltransferase
MVALGAENAAEMAQVHQAAFPDAQAWGARQFEELLRQTSVQSRAVVEQGKILSFLLVQIAADQAEILTIATLPAARRQGAAAALLIDAEPRLVRDGIKVWLLEVAEDNRDAIAFYQALGFRTDGRRRSYYQRLEGNRVDAILMSKPMARQATT